MNLIGISGLAGSGKDTIANILLKNDGFISLAFADPIKRFAADLWGFSKEQLWGASQNRNKHDLRYPMGENDYLTPRKVLQYIGNDCARALDESVWIRYAINVSNRLLTENGLDYTFDGGLIKNLNNSKFKCVIITDCRYHDERVAVKQIGGKLIKVIRPGSGLVGDFATHRSEAEMSTINTEIFDFVINNSGTLQDLEEMVKKLPISS